MPEQLKSNSIFKKLWLGLVLVLSGILRLFDLKMIPMGLHQDEAVNGYDALCLGTNLRDHHGNLLPLNLETFGDWTSPLITYITIPFVKIFGLSEWSTRLPVALMGIGAVWLMFKLLNQIGLGEKIALVGAFLLAISPWHITSSRMAIPPCIIPFLILLFFSVFLWAVDDLQKSRKLYLKCCIVAILAALPVYAYPGMKLFMPLVLFLACMIFYWKRPLAGVAILFSFAVFILPAVLPALLEPSKFNMRFNEISISQVPGNIIYNFSSRYFSYWLPEFYFGSGDKNTILHPPGMAMFPVVFAVFFYVGIGLCFYSAIRRKSNITGLKKEIVWLLMLWWLLFPIAASLTKDFFHIRRVIHGLPLTVIFSCIGFRFILEKLKSNLTIKGLYGAWYVLGLVSLGLFCNYFFKSYKQEWDPRASSQFGMAHAYNYALKNEAHFKGIVVDSRNIMPYIYYLFYSKRKPDSQLYEQLNLYQEMNNNWESTGKLDKFYFHKMPENLDKEARTISVISDEYGHQWYALMNMNDSLYLKKAW